MESPTDSFCRWKCRVTVRLSQFESLGKIVWRHHAIAYFQTNCIPRRRNGRYIPTTYFRQYIPTISPTGLGRRYIPTDFETELCPSVIITDGLFPSVIPLVFSSFLVVLRVSWIIKNKRIGIYTWWCFTMY